MKTKTTIAALLILLVLGTMSAWAEGTSKTNGPKYWIVPVAGIRTATSFGISSDDEGMIYNRIRLQKGFAFGLSVGYRLSDFLAVEATWSRMSPQVVGVIPGDPDPTNESLFRASQDLLQATMLVSAGYKIGAVNPYFILGLGMTSINPRGDIAGMNRVSWSLGLGFDGMVTKRIGIRVQGKFLPMYINKNDPALVDWTGGFVSAASRNNLNQWEFTAGLIFGF